MKIKHKMWCEAVAWLSVVCIACGEDTGQTADDANDAVPTAASTAVQPTPAASETDAPPVASVPDVAGPPAVASATAAAGAKSDDVGPAAATPASVPVSTPETKPSEDAATTKPTAMGGCCADCICRATKQPTPEDLEHDGPYTAKTFTIARGMNHGGATVYYPEDAEPPFAYAVFCPPYTATQSAFAAWGPFFASHGIVLATMDSVTTGDYPPQRALGLEELMETLQAQNEQSDSPLHTKLADSRGGVLGWSMGGGGAWIASGRHPEWRSAVTLAGHNVTATGWRESAAVSKVPTLMLNGATDTSILGGQNQTPNAYAAIPEDTPKLMYIVADLGHFDWGTPKTEANAIGRYVMAWQHLFLEGDERYRAMLLVEGPQASTWKTNLQMP